MVLRLRKTKVNQSRRSTHQFTHLNLPIRSSLEIKFVQSDHPPICSFIYQSIHRFIHTSINPFIYLHMCLCPLFYICFHIIIYSYVHPSIHPRICLYIIQYVTFYVFLSLPFIHPPIYTSMYPRIYPVKIRNYLCQTVIPYILNGARWLLNKL